MSDDKSSGTSDGEETKYDVYCSLCKTGFSSTVSYRQHLKGSKHAKAEKKDVMKQKYKKSYEEAISKLKGKTKNRGLNDAAGDEVQSAENQEGDEDAEVYTCNLCKKVCTGIVNYKTHLDGKYHAKQMKRKKLMEQLKHELPPSAPGDDRSGDKDREALYVNCPQLKPFAYCEQCSKSFSGPEGYQQHLASDVHKKMVQKLALVATVIGPVDKRSVGADDGNDLDPVPFAVCKDCDKTFYDPIPYHQHMASESHKKKVRKIRLMEKVKHMLVVENGEEEPHFKCVECDKVFGDPRVFYQHLSGSSHSKQKEKDQLLKELLERFPDLLRDTKKNAAVQSGSDTDDNSDFLACAVCHKSFSGPENARDHFRSKKHLKTVKEKERIKKILAKQKADKAADASTETTASKEISRTAKVSEACSDPSDDFEVIG